MAAPTRVSIAGGFVSTDLWNPWISGDATNWQTNDILVVLFETDLDTYGTPTVSGGSETFSQMPWSPVGNTGNTFLHGWWCRASQNVPTAPTFDFPTLPNHCVGTTLAIRGCITTGDPWDVVSSGSNTGTNATIPGATTTVDECYILVACSTGFNGTSTTRFSAWTNADITGLTERWDSCNTIGNGGGIGFADGTKPTAGTYGDTTVTEGFTSGHGYATMAFKPPAGAATSLPFPRRRERLHVPMMYPEVAWA